MPKKPAAPQVSIIVPVYDVEDYLSRCLDSILAQTLKEWECICVDDGSPDGCGQILDEYAAKDARFVVIHKENGGTSSARNAGLDAARGEYIGFVDPDDWIESETYEAALEAARRTDADIVQWRRIQEKLNKSTPIIDLPEGVFDIAQNPQYFTLKIWDKLFRREFILENGLRFPAGVRLGEDRPFSFKCYVLAKKLYFINRALYHYNCTRDDSQSSNQTESMILGEVEQIKSLCDFVADKCKDNADGYSKLLFEQKMGLKLNPLSRLHPPDCRLFRAVFPELNGQMLRYFLKKKSMRSLIMLLAAWHLDVPARALLRIRRTLKK